MRIQIFRDMPLKQKIEWIILGCVFLTSITAFISIYYISKAHDRILYRTVASNLSYSASEIQDSLDEENELADMILSNSTVQTYLPSLMDSHSGSQKRVIKDTIYNVLTNYLFNIPNRHISYISIQQDSNVISTHLSRYQSMPYELRMELVQRGHEAEGSTIWVSDYSQEYGLFLVKELREAASLSLRPIGTLIICIRPDTLIEQTSIYHSSYSAPSFFLLQNGRVIYCPENISEEDMETLSAKFHSGYRVETVNGQAFFIVQGYIKDYDWDYIAMVSYDSISRTISVTTIICITAIAFSVIAVLSLSARILNALTRHIDRLITKMHLLEEGCYHYPDDHYDYGNRKDEIGQLHTNFNRMACRIETLITENYTNELLKKDAQLKALESQMDPHFLYNTLDSIHWRANAIGAKDISQITTSLGNLLRISLSDTKPPFTIRDELILTENYMAIQKLRYPQRLEYQMDIPEEYQKLEIPKFTIQPLLENAIRYGLEESWEICQITVKAYSSEEKLIIEVKNNGSSFEENLLEKLDSREILPHGFGIGMLNIHKRLKIAYGDQYGLELFNKEDEQTGEEYAVVHVALPILPPEKE